MRIACPTCNTSYDAARLGLDIAQNQSAKATVACPVCASQFDADIAPRIVTTVEQWQQLANAPED